MNHKLVNLAIAFMIIVTVLGTGVHSAKASMYQSPTDLAITGSIRCGTLHGWGVWRATDSVSSISRTIYFEPNRSGMHKIDFYTLGSWAEVRMTPYWSNDGEKTWSSWGWSSAGYPPNIFRGNEVVLNLRTDSTSTAYKFVFYGYNPNKMVVWYRFYCQ